MTNSNNNLFFTITKQDQATHFSADQYSFTINLDQQKPGTNGKALWYYQFDRTDYDLNWVSWNQNHNDTKSWESDSSLQKTFAKGWEYLLLDIKGTLYSGFINKSKTQANVYYCKLEPLPPQDNFEIIY